MAITGREHTQTQVRRPAVGRPFPIAMIVFAIAAISLFGIWAFVKTRPTPATVMRRDIIGYLRAEAKSIAPPDQQAIVYAPFHAPVTKVYTTLGATVRRGEVLVELSHPSAENFLNEARAYLRRVQGEYETARVQYGAGADASRARLKAARTSEKSTPRTNEILVPSEDAEEPHTVIEEPSGERRLATERRTDIEVELNQAKSEMESALAPYRQRVEFAKQLVAEAVAGKKTALIRAPITGTVLVINARPGEIVGEDDKTPVAVIVNLDKLEVHATTPAENASLLKPGLPVQFTVDEIPNKQFDGTVDRITTHQEEKMGGLVKQQQAVVIVHFKNEDGFVKPDMKAQVAVKLGEAKNVLAVPNDALHTDESGMPIVKILRNGQWAPMVVKTGLTDGYFTEIKSGVKEGETVQVTPEVL